MEDCCRKQFWIVRRREGGIEVPISDEEVAKLYEETGWEVVALPPGQLTPEHKRYLLEVVQPKR